jgi:hypothetical protein
MISKPDQKISRCLSLITNCSYMRESNPDSNWEMIQCGKFSEHFHRMCEDYPENPKLA